MPVVSGVGRCVGQDEVVSVVSGVGRCVGQDEVVSVVSGGRTMWRTR